MNLHKANHNTKTYIWESPLGIPPLPLVPKAFSLLGVAWCFLLGFVPCIRAQTPICGTINTTNWTPAGNPYILGCDSTVPSGQTLTIQPGVVVWMGSNVTLTVSGSIQSLGLPNNRITFQAVVATQYWNMVQLNYSGATNRFKYCDFKNANTCISMGVAGANLTLVAEIMNCTFSNCRAQAIYGDAIGAYPGNCSAIRTAAVNPIIKNCVFNAMSNGCVFKTISRDISGVCASGHARGFANPIVIGNVFQDLGGTALLMTNTTAAQGGGAGMPVVVNNTFVNCRAAVDLRDSGSVIQWDARIQDNIFVGATNAVRKTGNLSLTASYNDFYGNATNFTGYPPSYGVCGPITNRNGTLSDLFFNICENPQFVGSNDFHLATNSASIDAGTPDSAFCDLCLSNSPSLGTQFPDQGAYGGPDACNSLDTVPKLPAAASISKSNNVIRLSWDGIPRSQYRVQYLTNLVLVETNIWLNLTNGRVLAMEKPMSIIVATNAANNKQFFRIESLGRTPGN